MKPLYLGLALLLIIIVPLRGQQQIPEEADDVLQYWNLRDKYYVVITANEYLDNTANLPFISISSAELVRVLESLGYKPLGQGVLSGAEVTDKKIRAILKETIDQGLTPQATLLVYYAGHGVKDPQGRDIWLQVSDEPLGSYSGISVGTIVHFLRDQGFQGDLAILVDACFSGDGVLASSLSLSDFGRQGKTALLTSASGEQSSYQVEIPGINASAFSYVLVNGLGKGFGKEIDPDEDGIVNSYELRAFTELELRTLKSQSQIRDEMTPYAVSIPAEVILAYKRDNIRNWTSTNRKNIIKITIDTSQRDQFSDIFFGRLRNSIAEVAVLSNDQIVGAVRPETGPQTFYAEADAIPGGKITLQFLAANKEILAKHDIVFPSEEPAKVGIIRDGSRIEAEPSEVVLSYRKDFYKVGTNVEIVGNADALLGSTYDGSIAAGSVEDIMEKYMGKTKIDA